MIASVLPGHQTEEGTLKVLAKPAEFCFPSGDGGIVCGAIASCSIDDGFDDGCGVMFFRLHEIRKFDVDLAAFSAQKPSQLIRLFLALLVSNVPDSGVSHLQIPAADGAEGGLFTFD